MQQVAVALLAEGPNQEKKSGPGFSDFRQDSWTQKVLGQLRSI